MLSSRMTRSLRSRLAMGAPGQPSTNSIETLSGQTPISSSQANGSEYQTAGNGSNKRLIPRWRHFKKLIGDYAVHLAGVGALYIAMPEFRQAVHTCFQELAAFIPLATAAAAGGWRGIVSILTRNK